MSPKFVFLFALTLTVASADIFGDLLGWDIVGALTGDTQEKSPAGQREDEQEGTSTCQCDGPSCSCCVDFNLTNIVDLGGPGCVKMRYISQSEGVALNVSYGENLLHSQVVKQKDRKGSCMDLLSKFAQICARFNDLKANDDGLEGCLHFEPHVLGEVTSKYHIGCFKMGPDGMVQDETATVPQEDDEDDKPSSTENEKEEGEDDDDGSSILDVVNHSAEQGISFLSDLLGIKTPGKKNKPTTTAKPEETTEAAEESEESQEDGRKFDSHRHRLGRVHIPNEIPKKD